MSETDLESRIPVIGLAQRGYAVVTQDVRGRFDSDGDWYPFINEVQDGNDTIEWVAKQPWCSGKVGLIGASYRGLTQWQAAQGASAHLMAAVPRVAYSNAYHNWVYTGGAFQLAFGLSWCIAVHKRSANRQYSVSTRIAPPGATPSGPAT